MSKIKVSEIRAKFPMYSDLSDEQLLIGIRKRYYSDIPMGQFASRIDFDTERERLQPEGGALEQLGSGFDDFRLGVQQLFTRDPAKSAALREEVAEKRQRDAKLNQGLIGKALNFAGAALPTLALPFGYLGAIGKAAPLVEGMIAGGITGATMPVAGNESRSLNAGAGAAGGAVLPAAALGLRRMLRPSSEAAPLASKAVTEYGIPLGAADMSGNNLVRATRSVLNDLPLTGGIGARQDAGKQSAFNAAVGRTFGADAASLTPEVMDAAKGQIKTELDRLWNGNTVSVDPQFLTRMQLLRQEATKLPQGEGARLISWIDDIESKIVPGAGGQATIPGEVANRFQTRLRKEGEAASGFLREALSGLRADVIGVFNRSVGGVDAEALRAARTRYKNFKTVEPLLDRAAAGTGGRAQGDVPAALLPEAVRRAYPALSSNTAPPALAELSQIGSRFLADRVPRTGGSMRAMVQNGAIVGGATGAGMMSNPMVPAIGLPVTIGLQKLLGSPKYGQSLLNGKSPRGLLDDPDLFPALQQFLQQSAQRVPAGLLPGLLGLDTAPLE